MSRPIRFSRRSLHGLLAAGFLSCAMSVAWAEGPFKVRTFPVQRTRGTAAEIGASSVKQPKRPLSLNYRAASWEKVLKDLTQDSGHTLIMKSAPPGRFSRRDGNRYTFTEAVRVLNHALEKKGFRLIEKQEYLILIELEEVRSKYERSPVPRQTGVAQVQGNAAASRPEDPIPVPEYPRSFTRVRARVADRSADGPAISQIGFEEPAKPEVVQAPPKLAPIVQAELTPRHSAVDVAKLVHEGFGKKSRLLKSGPEGLPAFEIRQETTPGADPVKRLAVGIDVEKNRLVIQGPEPSVRQFEQTIKLIEHAVEEGKKTVRVVPSNQDVDHMARQLGPTMNRLLALQTQAESRNQDRTAQPQPLNAQQPRSDTAEQPDEPLNPLQPNLRRDVTVTAVPGVGLVISGNDADVEAVMAVIREIEKLSIGAKPSIEILELSHVDSTQLSELLTNVYEDLTERVQVALPGQPQVAQQPQVTFIPVSKPNAIVIIAPEADMPGIIDIATKLDKPVDPDTEFEVFPLKSAIATQAATLLTNFFAEREGLGGTITAFADVRTNTLIVRARPRDLEEAASLIQKIDNDASGAVNKIKVVPLKNAVAQEVADVLNEVLQSLILPPGQTGLAAGAAAFNLTGTGESSTQIREIKSVALEFLKSQGGREELVRSGIMADVRITADPRINSLIITAPARSMQLMEALIDELDLIPTSVAEIKVFTLRNADATQAVDLLNALFTETAGIGGAGAAAQQAQGLQIAGATDVSNSLVSLRFSADVRTNSVIAVGGADALNVVDSILLRLDEDDLRERQFTTIRLKNTPAQDVADAINGFLDQQRDLSEAQPDLISNIQLLEQEIIVVAENVTNSLIISATPRYFSVIQNMVARLDAAPPQVIVQAMLVEVSLENTDEFGMELGIQDSILFNRSGMSLDGMGMPSEALNPGFLFNTPTLGNVNKGDPNTVGGQGLSNFAVGRQNSDLGFGGLVLSASSENISVLIRALAARRNVTVLSRPQIRTLDNVPAQIQVGQEIQIVTGGNTTQLGQITPITEPRDIGLILSVRPRINPDGTIVLDTIAQNSSLDESAGVPVFFNADGSTVNSPIINQTLAETTISVPNGHTAVLGGIITDSDSTIERKVPWLGDIPILGRAFRFDSTETERTELLIFLTPRVILNDADSEFIKQVETERIHIDEERAEDVHGPLFGVPPVNHQPIIHQLPTDGPIQLPDGTWMNLPEGEEQSSQQNTPTPERASIQQAGAWQNAPPTFKPAGPDQQSQFIHPSAPARRRPSPQQTRPEKEKRRFWPF